MARYTGADCRKCRRAKMKLYLKGSKCDSAKCPFEARPYPPGQHGRGRSKDSEYLLQLREKQKAKQIYGIFERQFRGYYEEASQRKARQVTTCCASLSHASTTLSSALGFGKSRDMARQLVRHGHFSSTGARSMSHRSACRRTTSSRFVRARSS